MRKPIGITITKDSDGREHHTGIYGLEFLLDCQFCNTEKFTEKSIRQYLKKLIKLLEMKTDMEPIFSGGVQGLDVIQFIITSQIAIHCVDSLEAVYIDMFSCKDFDISAARQLTKEWFEAKVVGEHVVYRGYGN